MNDKRRWFDGSATSKRTICALVAGACVLATTTGAGRSSRSNQTIDTEAGSYACDPADSAGVIAWNATAAAALGTDAAMPPPTMAVGMSYVQIAVYNAVQGIERSHPLYKWHVQGPRTASVDAAIAAAARGVLLTYFPVAEPRVQAAYDEALAAIPEGSAKNAGIAYGERAAAHVVRQRTGDGWNGSTTFDRSPAPGVWRPTAPAFLPFLAPWLATMKPFTLRSSHQFRPGGPPALTSHRYARDLNEVKGIGSATSTTRTAEQTEIARFFAGNLTVQLQGAYRDHLTRHCMDVADAAQYLVVGNLAAADGVLTSYDSKLHFGNWRPITAIPEAGTDRNPRTEADPNWQPLIVTPPFPDYLSGHCTVIGSVTRALRELQGSGRLDLNLFSTVTGTTRHYEWAFKLDREGIGARVWGGIHFRTADEVGSRVGKQVGHWLITHYFR